jgi:hypothetical protein
MRRATGWDEVRSALGVVLEALPEGVVLQLRPAALGDDRIAGHAWRRDGRLLSDAIPDNARPDAGPEIGFDPGVAAVALVARLRGEFGLATPSDIAYRAWWAADGTVHGLPELGLDPWLLAHYARVTPGDSPGRPAEVVRRTRAGWRIADAALDYTGRWVPTEVVNQAERLRLADRLVRLEPVAAAAAVAIWREGHGSPPPAPVGASLRWSAPSRDPAGQVPLEGFERAALARYLSSAPVAVAVFGFGADELDPRRPEVVPLSIRTDGSWVWSQSEAYRTGAYGLAPDLELVAHVRRIDYRLPSVDRAVLDRAARLVRERARA